MKSGVYQIRNELNGHRYIGSAMNLKNRWRNHLSNLRRGQHCNRHLQNAFDKYEEHVFTFEVLERVELATLLVEREQHYFDTLNPEYNLAPRAGSLLGYKHSPDACSRISASKKGRKRNPFNEDWRRKLKEARHNQKRSPPSKATRRKISEAQKGRKGKSPSEETRHRISEALKGRPRSEEHRRNLSKALKGRSLSAEHRRKLSEAGKGRAHTAEERRKMSEGLKGRTFSQEHRHRLSESLKRYFRRKEMVES